MTVENTGAESTAIAKTLGEYSNYMTGKVIGAVADLTWIKNDKTLMDHITSPFDIPTPKEKVKKRPDGFDYVSGAYMDHVTKEFMPLYKYNLLHVSESLGWISIIVTLEDRTTGNVELGAGSARIQVVRGTETPGFRDVIDYGNNIKSALSNAIKDAQKRFGVAADVYRRRESVPTQEERERFTAMRTKIAQISSIRVKAFNEAWSGLGTDFNEFLDGWQIYIENNSPKV